MNHLNVYYIAKWVHFKVTIIRISNFLLLKSNNDYCDIIIIISYLSHAWNNMEFTF